MVARNVSPDTVARNLIARREAAKASMMQAYNSEMTIEEQAVYSARQCLWQQACEDVRQFKLQHPSAFMFEEVIE